MATYNCHCLIMGIVDIVMYCCLTANILTKSFTEMFLKLSSMLNMYFVQTVEFD